MVIWLTQLSKSGKHLHFPYKAPMFYEIGGVLILVKLQASACNFTKITPPCVFFTFFKLRKWYQIAQRIPYISPSYLLVNSGWEVINYE